MWNLREETVPSHESNCTTDKNSCNAAVLFVMLILVLIFSNRSVVILRLSSPFDAVREAYVMLSHNNLIPPSAICADSSSP